MYNELTNKPEYIGYYVIQSGDTLYKIAREFNVNPKLLAEINGIEMDDYIYPNEVIMIPKNGVSYYITKDGDTLKEVSEIFNVEPRELINQNSKIYLLPGQMMFYKKQ